MTDESLQEEVPELDVVAKTTKRAKLDRTRPPNYVRTVHADAIGTAADEQKTSLVIERHNTDWIQRAKQFNSSLDSAQRAMLAASSQATERSIALIADAATSALIKAQRAQNASESASQSSVKASQRLQAAADKADN